MIKLLLPKMRKLDDFAERLWMLGSQIQEISRDLTDLIGQVSVHARSVQEKMKQFKEGLSYERPKAASVSRKKPLVHCVEPQGNKRKRNKDGKPSKYTE